MKKYVALLLALMMVFALCACGGGDDPAPSADAKKTFTIGIDPEYPPFSYLGDDGEYAGFDVETCKAACEKLGWEFKVFEVNWDQKLIQLDAGECDCVWAGMTLLPSMKEAGYVLSDPYFDNSQVMMVKEGSDIKSSKDLAGKVVGVMLGTSGESMLGEDGDQAELAATFGNLVTCESFLKCFAELGGGGVDCVIVDKPVADAYASSNEGFVVLDELLGTEQYGIAFRSGDQALCDQIEGAVAELVKDGTYAKIAEKYPDINPDALLLLK